MGVGRTKASAARYPAVPDGCGVEEIEALVMVRLRLAGVTPVSESASLRDSVGEGAPVESRSLIDVSAAGSGLGGRGDTGSGLSSTEKIDRSSPFHWSPLSWSF